MAKPTVSYNSSTGSDTSPSDCIASSVTSSSTASGTASGTTITFSGSVDLTGVADDDTDYIWCETLTGDRHLFQITAFSPSIGACRNLTVTEPIDATFSGKAWHVNGTRASLTSDGSYPDTKGADAGYIFELDGTFTYGDHLDVAVNRSIAVTNADPPIIIRAASGASSRPELQQTANDRILGTWSDIRVDVIGIKFSTSATATGTRGYVVAQQNDSTLALYDCVIDTTAGTHTTQAAIVASSGLRSLILVDCHIKGGTTYVVEADNNAHCYMHNCVIDGAGTHGTTAAVHANQYLHMSNCLVHDGAGAGVEIELHNTNDSWTFINNTVADCSGDGLQLTGTDTNTDSIAGCIIVSNLMVDNGGYGFDMPTSSGIDYEGASVIDHNCLYNNTSGGYNGVTAGSNDVTITADPFVDAANDNYALNTNAAGGALLRDAALHALPDGN